jgi:hypothetical protein
MTQPEHALPRRQTQIPDNGIGQAPRVNVREHEDASPHQDAPPHQDALHQDALPQDTLHQDTWVTNFIGRLTALVRHIGGKK